MGKEIKNINGEEFTLMHRNKTKEEASKIAKEKRKIGYNVRIFKLKNGYSIYYGNRQLFFSLINKINMCTELKPKYWEITSETIPIAYFPLKYANNEEEAVKHYKEVFFNRWEKERCSKFNYKAKAVFHYNK